MNNSSHFDTATDTVADLREGNILLNAVLPRSCLVHTADRFHSEGWLSCEQVIF